MKLPYDGLIFDMDGVLVDVTSSYRVAIKKTAEYFLKREVNMYEIKNIKNKIGMNNDWDATYELIGNKNMKYSEVKRVFQNYYLGILGIKGLIDNENLLVTKENIIKMKDIYKKLGIATGRPKNEALYVLKKFNLLKLFDSIITKDDVAREKPDPEPILKVMKDIKARNPIYIGDSSSDVVASYAAEIPCIYVGRQNIGTYTFQSMSQVVDYLL